MGASGWEYREPYAGGVEATLVAVWERVLASGDYLWNHRPPTSIGCTGLDRLALSTP